MSFVGTGDVRSGASHLAKEAGALGGRSGGGSSGCRGRGSGVLLGGSGHGRCRASLGGSGLRGRDGRARGGAGAAGGALTRHLEGFVCVKDSGEMRWCVW